ncbi:MAG: histidine kinase dimerization/phosphoacceptor domain -containing protein [Aureispira sp.]
MGFGLLKKIFFLFFLFFFVCSIQAEQYFTPKTQQLIANTNTLVYKTDFVRAQEAVTVYLEDKSLSLEEQFYGYFLQADITKSAGNPHLAISMLTSANELLINLEEEKQLLYKSLLYGNIAECYFNSLDYKEAKQNALKSISFHPSNALKSNGHAVNHLILGYTHRIDGESKKALEYYHSAIQSYQTTDNICELPLCYLKIADLHVLKKEFKQAEAYIDLAFYLSDSCNINQYKLLSHLSRVTLLEEKGLYKEAFQHLRKVETLRQKISRKKQLKLVSDLQIKHQTVLAQSQNQKLKETALILQENNTFKFILLSGSLIASITLVIFGSLLLRIRRKKNAKLKDQLTKINQQNKEREALLKEVHHRVKNNMQVITSLLHLQATDTSKLQEDPTSLFQSSQNRINAMALVHEMLYQSEDVSKISLPAYIKDLTQSLYTTLKAPEQEITFSLDIPDIPLGLDTAIPLGLLLNELLSNALLHGLKNQATGKVYVHIKTLEQNHYQLSIGDNGIGFNPAQDILRQSSLGLSITQKLIRQLQGSIKNVKDQAGCHYQIDFHAVD